MTKESQTLDRSASKGKAPAVEPSSTPHLGKRAMEMTALTDANGRPIILSPGASTSSAAPPPEKRPRIETPADVHDQGDDPPGGEDPGGDPPGDDPGGDPPGDDPGGDEPLGEDLINQLPRHLLLQIFSHIPEPKDRCNCAAVSRKWFVMQAAMRKSDLNAAAARDPSPPNPPQAFNSRISGCQANSVALACMAISMEARGELRELTIHGNGPAPPERRIHDRSLSILMRVSSSLKSISLINCPLISSLGLRSIARHCVALEKLHLCNMASVTDDCLEYFARKRTNLINLQLASMPKITDRTLDAFGQHLEKLSILHVEGCPLVTGEGVVSIATRQSNLEILTVTHMRLGDFVFQSFAHSCAHIKWLKLVDISGVSAVGYRWLGAVKNLQNIMLQACPGLNDSSFERVLPASFANLRQVFMGNCHTLSDAGLVDIARSTKHLEGLVLRECSGFTSRGLMEAISNCSGTLKMLAMFRCNFVRAPWNNLFPTCPRLAAVCIDECRGLGDGFLLWMGECCKGLRNVGITNMDEEVTDNGIQYFVQEIGPDNQIFRLNLANCRAIGNRSVWAITRHCPRLKLFILMGCSRVTDVGVGVITKRCTQLMGLDVSRCNIGDDGVRRLGKHLRRSMCTLYLSGCPRITDQSVVHLKRHNWMRLNLSGCTGISAEAVQSLREFFRVVVY